MPSNNAKHQTGKHIMAIIIHQHNQQEQDLLTGYEFHAVTVRDADGQGIQVIQAPSKGWTIEAIEGLEAYATARYDVWDMFLGAKWIGSSEV